MKEFEHLLVCLSEECAEVIQAVSKALRFGLDDGYPDRETDNRTDIENEIVDVLAVVTMLDEIGVTNLWNSEGASENIGRSMALKVLKKRKYIDYAKANGTIET